MKNYRLLGLYAHPDDEILGPAGTLAQYANEGVTIEWVCTTKGEAGEIDTAVNATPATLGALREQEMRCSAQTLGIQNVHFLGYRDSGMAGSDDNQNPQAYINADDTAVLTKLVQIIRTFKPHVALTFEPFGGYGHPDHIKIHHHTHQALKAAADPTFEPALGNPWQIQRLFYPILRLDMFEQMKLKMAARGLDIQFFDGIGERRAKGWPDDVYHFVNDVSQTFNRKWTALYCHASQYGPSNLFRQLPDVEMAEIFSTEYFALAWPQPTEGVRLTGLFDGVITDEE